MGRLSTSVQVTFSQIFSWDYTVSEDEYQPITKQALLFQLRKNLFFQTKIILSRQMDRRGITFEKLGRKLQVLRISLKITHSVRIAEWILDIVNLEKSSPYQISSLYCEVSRYSEDF